MSPRFREPPQERALAIADVDELIDLNRTEGLQLTGRSLPDHPFAYEGDPQAYVSGLLHQARFGFLVREVASANPSLSAEAAIAVAEQRLWRER